MKIEDKSLDIAIIGMACRFSNSRDYHEFWKNLVMGKNLIREVPKDRWDIGQYYATDKSEPNKSHSKWCSSIEELEYFDNHFFNISPREALIMDPHQRQLLEVSWQCIEDAGVPLERLQSKNTSVHIAGPNNDYGQRAFSLHNDINSYTNLGNYPSIQANRISFAFGFTGESVTTDAACASGLVVIHEARRILLTGESQYALVGGSNLILHPSRYISYSKARMLSPYGQCKTYDESADGFVPGEGVGVVLLQPLEDALRENNHIYCIIKGSSVNHIGKHTSITAPRVVAQKELVLSAYEEAGFSPETLGYMETHGTGTSLGDPIEVEALTRAFRQYTQNKQSCKIGSVKSNVGHLEGASGIAGLIKTILMLKNRQIPKTLNIKDVNPIINFKESPFSIADGLTDWQPMGENIPLRAGVSAFGFGGVGSHVLLEEYRKIQPKEENNSTHHLFLLSAKSKKSFEMTIEKWRAFVQTPDFHKMRIEDISRTTIKSRSAFPYRFGCKVNSLEELKEKLMNKNLEWVREEHDHLTLILGDMTLRGYDDFREIYDNNSLFREQVQSFEDYVPSHLWNSLFSSQWDESVEPLYTFIIYYSFVRTLMKLGLRTDFLIYEGMGFWVALAVAQVLKVQDIIQYLNGQLNCHQLQFQRPAITFLDHRSKERIIPYKIQRDYISGLSLNAWVELEDYTQCIEKAQNLYKRVITFKKFLEEWNQSLKLIGRNVEELLLDDNITNFNKGQISQIQLLMIIMVISSMGKLYQKWDLRDEPLQASPHFHELLDLISDQVISKENTVSLLGMEQPNMEEILHGMNERCHLLDKNKAYELLRESNGSLVEIDDYEDWISKGSTNSIGNYHDNIKGFLKVGEFQGIDNNKNSDMLWHNNLAEMLMDCIYYMWKQGSHILWDRYCPEDCYHKESLPVYQFSGKPFLLSWKDEEHPSPLHSTTTFHIQDSIIRDHIITGKHLIPGACMLIMALTDLQKNKKQPIPRLKNVVFLNPGIVEDEKTLELINIEDNGFKIVAKEEILCKGQYEVMEENSLSSVNIKEIQSYPSIDIKGLYSYLLQLGYAYGNTLQVIKDIKKIDDGYVLKLEEKYIDSDNSYSPHILDGIIQSVLAVQHLERDLKKEEGIYIPYGLKKLSIANSLKGDCYIIIHKNNVKHKGKSILATLDVYDTKGQPLLMMEDLQLQLCPYEFLQKDPLYYYRTTWIPAQIEEITWKSKKKALIFMDNILGSALSNSLMDRYEEVYYVNKGDGFYRQGNTFTINASSEEDYLELSNALYTQDNSNSLDYDIYYLWNYGSIGIHKVDEWKVREEGDIRSIFNLCKSLLRARKSNNINLLIAVSNSFVVNSEDKGEAYLYGGISGLAKTVSQVDPRIHVHMVDIPIDSMSLEEKAHLLMNEQSKEEQNFVIAYRGHQRFIQGIEPIRIFNTTGKPLLKDGNTYLVIGGMGGIGFHVVEKISQTVKANIIVIGSSEMNSKKEEQLRELNQYQSQVEYYSCYIADEGALRELIAKIKSLYKDIHGIIHCGGILRDKLLINKDWTTFKEVLAPKGQGTYLLNQLTKNEPLDFFVVFSSIVSVIGNIGQADYATANGFIDAFIHYRSQNHYPGKSIAINWTLWEETGMGKNEQAVKFFDKKTGLISRKGGVESLMNILDGSHKQVLVVGDKEAFQEFVHKKNIIIKGVNSPIISTNTYGEVVSQQEEVLSLESILTAMLAQLLGVEEHEIDEQTDLREFGLTSVSLNEFTEMINERLGTDINSTLLFEYSTMKEIGEYLMTQYKELIKPLVYKEETLSNDIVEQVDSSDNLENILGEMLADLLGVEESDMDEKVDLREFGLDSISLNEFTDSINERLSTNMNSTLLFEYSTLKEIAQYIRSEYKETLKQVTKPLQTDNKTTEHYVQDKKQLVEKQIIEKQQYKEEIGVSFSNRQHIQHTHEESSTDIAIIGISGRMPQSDDLQEFWENLVGQVDMITEIPEDRWNWKDYYGDPHKEENKANNKWGGFLRDIRSFDAKFFNLSPREVELMDPQQRILLEEVWHLFEDAGYKPSSLWGSKTGVFIGVGNDDYNQLIGTSNIPLDSHAATGSYFSIVANRISYLLNLQGPSTIVDTACSSSLVSMHQAVQSIRNGECTMAVTGGINIICTPRPYLSFSHAGMLSKDGRCKTFDKGANGYVRAEGVGVVLLKPLQKAIEDRDHIYGVVKGTAINHNGYTNSLTAPNPNSQAEVIMKAFEQGNIKPSTVNYMETHGTGTSLGDPIEVNGLKKAFKEMSSQGDSLGKDHCGLGAVKTNIGHLEFGAGIAGVLKVLLSMKHKMIPGNLHLNELNPYINFEDSPFYVIEDNRPWEALKDSYGKDLPRRAGVSSFGFGGANAHVVLEEYIPQKDYTLDSWSNSQALILLSAKNEDQLNAYAKRLYDYIEDEKPSDRQLMHIAYTLQIGREAMEERMALLTDSVQDLQSKLKAFIEGQGKIKTLYRGRVKKHKEIISILEEDKVFSITLQEWINQKKYHKLLELWVKGLSIDWCTLYGENKPSCISLPTYPFEKDHYWISYPPVRPEKNMLLSTVLHPMLHQNTSHLRETRFSSIFTGQENFLENHVIGGKKVLPGVAYLEMVREAYTQAASLPTAGNCLTIKNMVWSSPIIVEGTSVQVHTALHLEENNEIAVEIYSGESTEKDKHRVHGQCIVQLNPMEEEREMDISSIKQECTKGTLWADECYRIYESMGIHYGESHRGIEQIELGDGQVLAKLSIPDSDLGEDSYILHPTLMDSALQGTIGLIIGNQGEIPQKPYIPLALNELRIYGTCTPTMWARVVYSNHLNDRNVGSSQVQEFDIYLSDEQGKIKVEMKGYLARMLENNPIMTHENKYYEKVCLDIMEGKLSEEAFNALINDEERIVSYERAN